MSSSAQSPDVRPTRGLGYGRDVEEPTIATTRCPATSWEELVAALTSWCGAVSGVFEQPRILTTDDGSARLLKQAVAAELGVFAGIEVLTVTAWMERLHEEVGEVSPWRGPALELAVMEVLGNPEFVASYPVLADHLASGSARLRSLSRRVAQLLRHYADQALDRLGSWLDDPDEAATQLPEHLAWQPELTLRVVELLAFDPHEEHARLIDHLGEPSGPRTALVLTEPLAPSAEQLIAAFGDANELTIVELSPTSVPQSVTWLGSQGLVRQTEVLRDELCHILAENPTLEPRDVLIVVPDVAAWWPALSLVLSPVADAEHPGRGLRLGRPSRATTPQPVLQALAKATRLRASRAETSQVLDLLMLDAVRHRWKLPGRDELSGLLHRAGIRWGLDAAHRAEHDLAQVVTNTWARGLDRLLAALALDPDNTGLSVGPAEAVATLELDVIGSLAEVISRLRRHTAQSQPATMPEWVARARQFIDDVLGLPHADEGLIQEAVTMLARLGAHTADSSAVLSATDFAWFVDRLAAARGARGQVGNGNLTVVAEGDLVGVGFPVVALLGVADQPAQLPPDAVPGMLPEVGLQRHQRLASYARAAEHLVVVHQARVVKGAATGTPEVLTWLWRSLGISPKLQLSPARSDSPQAFVGSRPSFDRAGFATVNQPQPRHSLATLRRRAALALPEVPTSPQLTLDEATRFLKDPAGAFLRERAGIREAPAPPAEDLLPILPNGLQTWAIRSRLLTAARTGRQPEQAMASEARREVLPRGALGGAVIEAEVALIAQLWSAARPDWERPTRQVTVDLEVAGMTLSGLVTLRGDHVVVLSPSDLPTPLFEPWVQLLALAALGHPCPARIHYLQRHYGRVSPAMVELRPPADPMTALTHLVTATRAARSRLIPVPPSPARALVEGQARGTLNRAAWDLPTSHWDSPWAWRCATWAHFYDGSAAQLFDDQPQPGDPIGDPQFGAFGAWATVLHRPLWEAAR